MKKYTQELLAQIKSEVDGFKSDGLTGFDFYNSCTQVVTKAFNQLKKFILEYEFNSPQEEIEFFKEVKPYFYGEVLYYKELTQIEIMKPAVSDRKELIKYYRMIDDNYQFSLKKYELSMHYLRTQVVNADDIIFLRSRQEEQLIHTDIIDFDNRFSTPASSELGRIKAYKMVLEYVNGKIADIKQPESQQVVRYEVESKLKWTGNRIALIELGYALHASNMINDGKVSIREVLKTLQYIFNFRLSDFYRGFQEIRMKKYGNTIFMEELRDIILRRINDSDGNNDQDMQNDIGE